LGRTTIIPGDTLGLTIFGKRRDDGFSGTGHPNATVLKKCRLDGSGFIFVPYAGGSRPPANYLPQAIRRIITNKTVRQQDPDPAGSGAPFWPVTGDRVALWASVGAQAFMHERARPAPFATIASHVRGV